MIQWDSIIQAVSNKLPELFYDDPVIALAGAHAKGVADEKSDLDIFVFYDEAKPMEERQAILKAFSDNPDNCWVSEGAPWGGSGDFMYQGIPVELVLRPKTMMEQKISDCLEGKIDINPQTWTSNGYYSFAFISELDFLKPIRDNQGWLNELKQKAHPYPKKLKQAIISEFLSRASTWMGNFHYESAINRLDVLFLSPIVLHTVLDMVQVIFAYNEVYFTGDKKIVPMLEKMTYCPAGLLKNLSFLLSVPKDVEEAQRQAKLLETMYKELKERVQQ